MSYAEWGDPMQNLIDEAVAERDEAIEHLRTLLAPSPSPRTPKAMADHTQRILGAARDFLRRVVAEGNEEEQ